MPPRMVIVVPLPAKDRDDRQLPGARQRAELKRLLRAFGSWFGSATALPSWGSWKASPRSPLTLDREQIALLVVTTPQRYREKRSRMKMLLRQVGMRLRQKEMAVIVFRQEKGMFLIPCR